MKKLIIISTALAIAATATAAQAGDTLFGSLGDAVVKARNAVRTAHPTEVKALEADGGNFRMYVFTAPGNKDVECLMIAGTQKGGAACYPKGQPASK